MLKKCFFLIILVALLGTATKTSAETENIKLEHWLNRLKYAENCPLQGMVDSNGLLSYSAYCFQSQTFQSYALKYNLFPNAEKAEILNFLSDEQWQRELVRKMIAEKDGWRHWYVSVKTKIGMPPI